MRLSPLVWSPGPNFKDGWVATRVHGCGEAAAGRQTSFQSRRLSYLSPSRGRRKSVIPPSGPRHPPLVGGRTSLTPMEIALFVGVVTWFTFTALLVWLLDLLPGTTRRNRWKA